MGARVCPCRTFLDYFISSHCVLSTMLEYEQCSRQIKYYPSPEEITILEDKMSQETRWSLNTEKPKETITSWVPFLLLHLDGRLSCPGRPLLSSRFELLSHKMVVAQLNFRFIVCFHILSIWQVSASRFPIRKRQDLKLLKIWKCQKFRTF